MTSSSVTRKRQARGEARIQSLLEAAEIVFARAGYSKATTNEIAAEGDVSPATLYQFFKNKEEIANALAVKYVKELERRHAEFDLAVAATLPINRMVESVFLPIFEFHKAHPAFITLFISAPIANETREAKMALSGKLVEQLARLLTLRNPRLSDREAIYQAEVGLLVFKGFLSEISEASAKRRAKLIESLIELLSMQFSSIPRRE